MRTLLYLHIFIMLAHNIALPKTTETTPNVHDRIKILKHKITEQMKRKQKLSQLLEPINERDVIDDNYEYVNIETRPITPIMDNDQRKVSDKFKLRELKTTSERSKMIIEVIKPYRTVRKGKYKVRKPIDIFYRRIFQNNIKDTPIQWMHCQDLVTPYIVGHKKVLGAPKSMKMTDHTVMRLMQLISVNTTGHSKEDIMSILYQISNLQIRLFQWDITSIKSLLNLLSYEKNHTFRTLKYGLKALFASWHLDLGNSSNLLRQSRLFRPPCLTVDNNYGGSTKTSKFLRYTKSTQPKSTCAAEDYNECND